MKVFLLGLIGLCCFPSFCAPTAKNAFIITIKEHSISVAAPDASLKSEKKMSVIIENKTISKIIGKLEQGGQPLHFVSLAPNSFVALDFTNKIGEKVEFIPMAPAFQEAVLEIGQKSYEIPPQR